MRQADKTHEKCKWGWLESDHDKLRNHKTYTVRRHSRAAQLLYAFARGVPRSVLESKIDRHVEGGIRSLVNSKAKKHEVPTEGLVEWLDGAD